MYPIDAVKRNNVNVIGQGKKTVMLAHGFGCDQKMWRFLTPLLEDDYRIVLFDYVGSGQAEHQLYDKKRYSTLAGYAQDLIEIGQELELTNCLFIGHSVSSSIGMLASLNAPNLFSHLVMVCPSPCFLNLPPDYMGGFDKSDLEELIDLMDKNYMGWANYLAPLVMGQNNNLDMVAELENSFCSTDPMYAKPFAKATFFADDRDKLELVQLPTLILQSSDDNLASPTIGEYMRDKIPNAQLEVIDSHGHCLHMTEPTRVNTLTRQFVGESR